MCSNNRQTEFDTRSTNWLNITTVAMKFRSAFGCLANADCLVIACSWIQNNVGLAEIFFKRHVVSKKIPDDKS